VCVVKLLVTLYLDTDSEASTAAVLAGSALREYFEPVWVDPLPMKGIYLVVQERDGTFELKSAHASEIKAEQDAETLAGMAREDDVFHIAEIVSSI
jgi:hypothetical protein